MNRRVSPSRRNVENGHRPLTMPFRMPQIFRPKEQRIADNPAQSKHQAHKEVGIIHLLFICLSLAIAAAGALYHLHVRFEGVRLGYEASEQRKIQTKLMLQRRELRLELASMKELGRIEDEAREKLGMETPKAEDFVHVNKTKKVVTVSGGAL
jgi:cell division protein FtsL